MLRRSFIPFVAAVGVFALVSLLCLASTTGRECQKMAEKRLSSVGSAVREILTSSLREVNNTLTYVGNQLIQEDRMDLQKLAHHLKMIEKGRYYQDATIYSYTCLDWVNSENYMVANGLEGIVKTPVHVRHRAYTTICPYNPWKLILCEPSYGFSSGSWIVPFGMGVFDANGEFWGILTGGINISTLSQKIKQTVLDPLVDFIISDGGCHVICSSLPDDEKSLSAVAHAIFVACDGSSQERRILNPPFQSNATDFYGYHKIDAQPIYVFMGINKKTLQSHFLSLFLPQVAAVIGFSLFSLLALYIFWRKSTRSVKALTQAVRPLVTGNEIVFTQAYTPELEELKYELQRISDFIQNLREVCTKTTGLEEENRRLEHNLQVLDESLIGKEAILEQIHREQLLVVKDITSLVTVLLKNWTGHLDLALSPAQHVQFLQSMLDSLQQLRTATANVQSSAEIHPGNILKECLKIQFAIAFSKGVKLSSTIPKDVPCCLGNELCLKQVLVSLLFKAIQSTPRGGEVQAELALVSSEGKVCLLFTIRDNGFGLTEEDLSRFTKEGSRLSPLTLELSAIERLVELHGGHLNIETLWQEGNIFTVSFPYESAAVHKKDSNLIFGIAP